MKLDQLQILPTLFKGVGCGALIYLAVMFWKTEKQIHQIIPVILCVAGFILGGFEHSIACAFYLGSSVTTVAEFFTGLLYILIVAVGNAIGSLTIRGLWKGLVK
jgi:formate/nitrite transporter FocA (FNT family)